MMPVYLIQTGDNGPVKVGFSDGVHSRLVKIQSDTPERCVILRILDGGRELEAALHARFAHLKIRAEWFRFDLDMLDDLGAPDLSIHKSRIAKRVERHLWSPEARARAAVGQSALNADPERKAARDAKVRATMLGKVKIEVVADVARRAGGWLRLATALGVPITEIITWKAIPMRHAEAAAAVARLPVMKITTVLAREAA